MTFKYDCKYDIIIWNTSKWYKTKEKEATGFNINSEW